MKAKIFDFFRLLGASCLFMVTIFGLVALFSTVSVHVSFLFVGLGICVLFCLLLWGVFKLFGGKGSSPAETFKKSIETLRKQGLLVGTDYKAKRAFQVDELEDEGKHFFIEMEDASVLFLSGQYLYDYDPESEPKLNTPRRFPSTDFTVMRHKLEGWVVEIICRGAALEPETIAPAFALKDFEADRVPEDGAIIRDASYGEIKQQRLAIAR